MRGKCNYLKSDFVKSKQIVCVRKFLIKMLLSKQEFAKSRALRACAPTRLPSFFARPTRLRAHAPARLKTLFARLTRPRAHSLARLRTLYTRYIVKTTKTTFYPTFTCSILRILPLKTCQYLSNN